MLKNGLGPLMNLPCEWPILDGVRWIQKTSFLRFRLPLKASSQCESLLRESKQRALLRIVKRHII